MQSVASSGKNYSPSKSILELVKYCMQGSNRWFTIALMLAMPLYVFFDVKDAMMSDYLSMLVRNKPGYTIGGYFTQYASFFATRLVLLVFNDVSISILFFNSLRTSLKEYLRLESADFRAHTLGNLLSKQYEKGEAISTIVSYVVIDTVGTLAKVFSLLSHVCIGTSVGVSIGLALVVLLYHAFFLYAFQPISRLQRASFAEKINSRSVVEAEASSFDIIKTYDIAKQSSTKVHNAFKRRERAGIEYFGCLSRSRCVYKLFELSMFMLILTFYFLGQVELCILAAKCKQIQTIHEDLMVMIVSLQNLAESFNIFCTLEMDKRPVLVRPVQVGQFESLTCEGAVFQQVLRDVNFTVKRNEKVAIVGPNTSGKTLLLSTLNGLCSYSGSIKINGEELSRIDRESLYRTTTCIAQECSYVTGTIMKNLRFGNNHSEEKIVEYCKQYGVHNTFSELDGGYYKRCGTLAPELSGGQRQRVSFIRGVVRETPVLAVDDCLTSVNTCDRNMLLKRLISLEDRTVIMTCDVPSLWHHFDKIILLDGTSAICGTYDELKNRLLGTNQ